MFDLLLINVSGMSLFPFDIAKVRQYSEQNKLFADFRLNYMRHGSQFVTRNQGGGRPRTLLKSWGQVPES